MEEITLRRPLTDVVIHEDGTLNLSELSKSPKKSKPEKEEKKGEPPVIRIGLINIEEGAISFLNKRRSHPSLPAVCSYGLRNPFLLCGPMA